jgi:hypothetical protein
MKNTNNTPPYRLGLLCIIPLVGFFVGVGLILYGIFRYKDKKLVIIGSAGVIITICIYFSLFYSMSHGGYKGGFVSISQSELNKLADNVEFYKLKTGQYPANLKEIIIDNPAINIEDPLIIAKMDKNIKTTYRYQKSGNQYRLFSVGLDGKPGTVDDLYPIKKPSDFKYGFIKK